MEKRVPDNEIDKTFRSGIESMEMEPSKHFWETAEKNIALRAEKVSRKSAARWKRISFLTSLLLITSIFYIGYLRLNTNDPLPVASVSTTVEASTDTISRNIADHVAVDNLRDQRGTTETINIENSKSTAKSSSLTVTEQNTVDGTGIDVVHTSNKSKSKETNHSQIPEHVQFSNQTELLVQEPSKDNQGEQQPQEILPNLENDSILIETETQVFVTPEISPVEDSTPLVDLVANGQDTAEFMHEPSDTVVNSGSSSRSLFVSAYYSPSLATQRISQNDSQDNVNQEEGNNVFGEEDQGHFSWTTGVNIGYELSDKWTLRSGISYSSFQFPISRKTIYSSGSSSIGKYSLFTSSGTTEFYYEDGDSLEVQEDSYQSLGYVSIPMQASYNFVRRDFGFFVTAGAIPGFLSHSKAHFRLLEDNEDEISIETDINGTRRFRMGYIVGLGVGYRISDHFTLMAEPVISGNLQPINKNTDYNTRSFTFGLSTGLSYYF